MASTASCCAISTPTCHAAQRASFFEARAQVWYNSDAAARTGTQRHVGKAAHHLRAGHKRVSTTKSKV